MEVGIVVHKLLINVHYILITSSNQIHHDVNGICTQFKLDPRHSNYVMLSLYAKKKIKAFTHTTTMVNIEESSMQ